VIEELRPTLLDNMGLVAALRWQADESCNQGNIQLIADLPDDEPKLDAESAIAVFRTVQEALSNVLKHASATEVRLVMAQHDGQASITVEDNGVGLPQGAELRAGAHGLRQMKFRMQAVGGFCEVGNGSVTGTIVTARFPIGSRGG
jgi:two-component system, NarL family, sensor histidine kinase UhpB